MFKRLIRTLTGQGKAEDKHKQFPEPERKLILRKARTALSNRRYDEIKNLLTPLLLSNQDDAEALSLEGLRLFESGHEDLSLKVLQRAVVCGSEDPLALRQLVMSLSNRGDYLAALPLAERAAPSFSSDAYFLKALGWLYLYVDRYEEAATALNKALELAPRELALAILHNLWTLKGCSQLLLRKSPLTPKSEQIQNRLIKELLSKSKRAELDETDSKNLIVLAYQGPEFIDRAKQEADRLLERECIESGTALVLSQLYSMMGDLEQAIRTTERARSMGAAATYQLGLLKATKGGKGWLPAWQMQNEAYAEMNPAKILSGIRPWQGERLGKKRLLVYQEQGFGDVLIALRFLKALSSRGIRAVFWVYASMAPLLATANTGVEILPRAPGEKKPPEAADCAFAIPLFFLINALKLSPIELKEPVPIEALPGRCETWRDRLKAEKRLRVGLAAYGNPWRVDDWYRSVPLEALEPLSRLPDICWVNLSVDERSERSQLIEKFSMQDPTPDLHDFADTAAIVDALDLVIAIDCSVAHLAGALGKRVWVLAPSSIDLRWRIGEDDQPWWPSSRVFRSPSPGLWQEAIDSVRVELSREIEAHSG